MNVIYTIYAHIILSTNLLYNYLKFNLLSFYSGYYCSTPSIQTACTAGSYCPTGSTAQNTCPAGKLYIYIIVNICYYKYCSTY